MTKRVWLALGLACLSTFGAPAAAQTSVTGLISRDEAARLGLVRAWAVQIGVGGGRDRLAGVVCEGDVVVAYTQRGVLQVIDAERGATLWTRQIGDPTQNFYAPAIDGKHLAVAHADEVTLVERSDGRELWTKRIEGVPSASPALGPLRVFVPTLRGRLMALPLDNPDDDGWFFASSGSIEVAPLVTPKSVVWALTSGLAFCSAQDKANIRFQLHTRGSVSAPMAFREPLIYIASHDQELYAIDEMNGSERWRFAMGSQISQGPVVADDILLVSPEGGDLFCLGSAEGESRWSVRSVVRVSSVSPQRVYGVDTLGRLLSLDRATGALRGHLMTPRMDVPVTNGVNDRIFLASSTGLVQCLRESALDRPAPTQPPAAKPEPAKAGDAESEDASEETPEEASP